MQNQITYVKHITLKRIKISTNVVAHYHHWREIRDREQMFPQPTLIYRCISYFCSNKTQRQVLKLHKILIKTLSVTKYYAFNYHNLYSAFNAYNPTLCNPTFRMNKSFLSLNVMWYCVCVCVSLDQDLVGFGRGGGLLIYKVNRGCQSRTTS